MPPTVRNAVPFLELRSFRWAQVFLLHVFSPPQLPLT